MLVPGTQMHWVTFGFVCIELVILFYLFIHRLARPDDKTSGLNIILIVLLLVYNITGGLLPDPNLPGSFFIQESIAYATGFITPCYFPYYVFKAFSLEKMKFHAYKGVYLFLIFPYIIFLFVFGFSGSLNTAKNVLVIPVLYALWVIYSLFKAVRYKYNNQISSTESKEELAVLFLSLATWVGLPVIDYWNIGQAVEATTTNFGFLLLFSLQVKRHIKEIRLEHQRLIDSEKRLLLLNNNLQWEVTRVTHELEKIIEQQANAFINLTHEIQGPLALINDNLSKSAHQTQDNDGFYVMKSNLDRLSDDIEDLIHLKKAFKGLSTYHHGLISNFSAVIKDSLILINTSLQLVGQSGHTDILTSKNNFDANCKRYNLTRREIEIARLMEKGHTNNEIGELLFISNRTVAKHIQNLFEKVGASNKLELINKLNAT